MVLPNMALCIMLFPNQTSGLFNYYVDFFFPFSFPRSASFCTVSSKPLLKFDKLSHKIHNGIHQWCCQEENVSHEDVGQRRHLLGKAVEHGCAQYGHSTDVRKASVESSELISRGSNLQYCL